MKKRIIAVILLAVMLLPFFGSAAYAFPFDKYNIENQKLDVFVGYNGDKKELAGQGLALDLTVTFTGYSGTSIYTDEEYRQDAHVVIRLPDGFFYPEKSNKTDPDNYYFRASESGSFYKWYQEEGYQKYSDNDVDWAIYHELYEIQMYQPDRGQSLQDAMDKKAEEFKNVVYSSQYDPNYIGNTAKTPISIEKDANGGYKIVTNGFFDDTGYWTIEEQWGGFKESYLEGRYYTRITAIPELPGTFIVVCFRQRRAFTATIEGPSHTEYKAVYDRGKQRIEEYWSKDIGEQFLNFEKLMTITWGEPVISAAATKDSKETKESKSTEETKRHDSVTQHAKDESGEDSGVSIPAAIIIGGGSAVAAVGAAAAATGSGKKGDDEKKKKTYKMYVKKNFGDALRRGGDPVSVCARIAEVYAGTERDRDDLTANIAVSGEGLKVHGAVLSGRYCEAKVSVPADSKDDSATVTFTYSGEGGTFSNHIIFRISDGPQLKFLEETAPGSGEFTPYHQNCGINAIAGDGCTYTEHFMIEDAPVPPKVSDITAVDPGEFDVAFEATANPSVFKISVQNRTQADEERDLFASVSRRSFDIHVKVEGEKEPVMGNVTVNLYPEGLSISSRQEGEKNGIKYVRVQAYEKDNVGGLDRPWQVTEMKIVLAVRKEDKAVINPTEAEYKFDKLKGSGGKGTWFDHEESLAAKYEYNQSWGIWNDDFIYTFEPKASLVEPDNGFFLVLLPVSATYEGKEYTAEVPIRLRGRDMDPMETWEQEYAKLKERIEKFSLPDNKEYWLKKFEEMANDPIPSVEELRLTSKYVVRQYMRYWTVQGMKYRDDAEMYDVIVNYLEWAKFFGDVAFSILVNMYAGPMAEALISPAKDFFTSAIGEVIGAWNNGQKIDVDKFEFSKNLAAAGDNLVSGAIDITNWKAAAATLGCYFAYASVKNFILTLREKNKFDVYGALVKGFSDMTSQALKAAAAHLFSAWLKNCSKFRSKISQYCGKFVTKNLGEGKFLDMRNMDGLVKDEILRKYVDGLFGMAVDKLMEVAGDVHDNIVKSQTGFEFDEKGHVIATFFFDVLDKHYVCSVDATELLSNVDKLMTGGLFTYVYDQIFGNVPCAAAMMPFPKDPPLPKKD